MVNHFLERLETRPGQTVRRDYHFERPRVDMQGATHNDESNPLEDYAYPGGFTDKDRGIHLAKRAQERHRHDYRLAEGRSNQHMLASGHFLQLSHHPNTDWNDLWLLTEVRHEGRQPQVLEESLVPGQHDSDFQQGYRNTFLATPRKAPYRPPLRHPKPKIFGSQTAVVTGLKGQEIHCDKHGRIKVQFHWDREGAGNDRSSCWLRVSSSWAGNGYGGMVVPRVGMEVLVTFLEGDPDRPLVSGCLYHAEHLPPGKLPADQTQSVFKTLSSPGGGGSNELRIEDRAGQEHIYIHAQRDWDQIVKHDQTISVGHERHDRVQANSYSEFGAEEHRTVAGARLTEVKMSDHLTVGGTQHIRVADGLLAEAGQEVHIKAGNKLVIEAGLEVTIKVGGTFIKLDASGVKMIEPQPVGSPGNGSGAAPRLPGVATPVGADEAGEMLTPAQTQTMKRTPFCEQCERAAKEAKP